MQALGSCQFLLGVLGNQAAAPQHLMVPGIFTRVPSTATHLQDEEAKEWCEVELAKQWGQDATVDLQVGLSDLWGARAGRQAGRQGNR